MPRNLPSLVALLPLLVACAPPGDGGETSIATSNEQVLNRGADKDAWWQSLPRESWLRLERIETPTDQDWFEVYRVADGVLAIYEPGQFEEVISYLITGEDEALLFDTGLGIGDIGRLVDALTTLPVTVLNSHTHYDHIGGNHRFDRILATATDFTASHAAGIAHGAVAEFVGDGWIWKPTPAGFEGDGYHIRPFRIAATVEDGQIIDLGGRRLQVLLTPGHAPDALCLLDRANRLLLTGDTFYPAPLYTHLEGSDFRSYRDSAERLARLAGEVDWLLPSHNETPVSAAYLPRMADAFRRIATGDAEYALTDGNREYPFDGFSVIVDPAALGGVTDQASR